MIIYGRRVIYEYIRSGRKPKVIYIQKGTRLENGLLETISGLNAVVVSQREINKITSARNHQGVAAEIDPLITVDRKEIIRFSKESNKPILVLDHINDVRNLGAMIRTAEAFGFSGVIISSRRAAPITPTVVKTSAGAIFHINISIYNISRFLREFKSVGGWIITLDMKGKDITGVKIPRPCALVVGGEGEGVSQNVLKQSDIVVKIPMRGKVESLNASVAGGIAMFIIRFFHP